MDNMVFWNYPENVVLKKGDIGWSSKNQDSSLLLRRAQCLFKQAFEKQPVPFKFQEYYDFLYDMAISIGSSLHKGQFRKYHNPPVPYFVHPMRVATAVSNHPISKEFPEIIAATYLHDVSEDCGVPISMISEYFGKTVASFVDDLTDKFKDAQDSNGKLLPRQQRNALEIERLKGVCRASKIVKLCDRIDNITDMNKCNLGGFAVKYAHETQLLKNAIGDADGELASRLQEIVDGILK